MSRAVLGPEIGARTPRLIWMTTGAWTSRHHLEYSDSRDLLAGASPGLYASVAARSFGSGHEFQTIRVSRGEPMLTAGGPNGSGLAARSDRIRSIA